MCPENGFAALQTYGHLDVTMTSCTCHQRKLDSVCSHSVLPLFISLLLDDFDTLSMCFLILKK